MKLSKFETFTNGLYEDPWHKLKQYTDARIAMGRVGCSIPTQALLNFQLSHAQAKDAVFHQLNVEDMQRKLTDLKFPSLVVKSKALNKEIYLKRPDYGRQLSQQSQTQLTEYVADHPQPYDVCIVAGDGLSARAIEENAIAYINALREHILAEGWTLAPIVIATGSRVALGDEVAQTFNAAMLIMLIGERPGLSSPDSMGVYYTWKARKGCLDSSRNCISNVRPAGLSIQIATQRLMALMRNSFRLQRSGVDLKDDHVVPLHSNENPPKLLF
ncbi:ethanolamine ammonia-lyase subunit EutC [Acinetobacter nematophilus]|uniref:Ethanolamine ammonia-lyase small subunit n=1 Tax=Acinetobacter nematophilus TaxID=2994642 RepID=A0A9X3DV36_9GAMM|nr:ethanolamine ammonia-lyase subunit EutC [Acinetobacter nematophilus]MCX5468545.1 ethanolamine ammonia-lyase subunit EutC [Acinetobacter nematophilus]